MSQFARITLILLLLVRSGVSLAESKSDSKKILAIYSAKSDRAFYIFNKERQNNFNSEIDTVFLKIEKEFSFRTIKKEDLKYYNFQTITQTVLHFVHSLRNQDQLSLKGRENAESRKKFQFNFIGLSHAIRKSNELNLQINSEQYTKLHDILVSQSTGLFYASYREKLKSDFFWTSYFLHQLQYPMDLVSLHLKSAQQWPIYSSQMANLALASAIEINSTTAAQVDFLYSKAKVDWLDDRQIRQLQKNYLKQLNKLGDSEKVKVIKREMANRLLWIETAHLIKNPLLILNYLQFVIGYIFVAWPLEVILVLLSLMVFAFQSHAVLTDEEKKSSKKNPAKKIWLMFVKSYMGSQVPFFSKLAASFVLFGIGLYFNSARNFVESLLANM